MNELPERKDCRVCGITWAEIGLPYRRNRQICNSYECRRVVDRETHARYRKTVKVDPLAHASRTQGSFLVPSNERGQSRGLTESFFCWHCHKEHKPKEIVHTLGLICACGVAYVFTIGMRGEYSTIVRVDRLK